MPGGGDVGAGAAAHSSTNAKERPIRSVELYRLLLAGLLTWRSIGALRWESWVHPPDDCSGCRRTSLPDVAQTWQTLALFVREA